VIIANLIQCVNRYDIVISDLAALSFKRKAQPLLGLLTMPLGLL